MRQVVVDSNVRMKANPISWASKDNEIIGHCGFILRQFRAADRYWPIAKIRTG